MSITKNFFDVDDRELDTRQSYKQRKNQFKQQFSKSPREVCLERSASKNRSQFQLFDQPAEVYSTLNVN